MPRRLGDLDPGITPRPSRRSLVQPTLHADHRLRGPGAASRRRDPAFKFRDDERRAVGHQAADSLTVAGPPPSRAFKRMSSTVISPIPLLGPHRLGNSPQRPSLSPQSPPDLVDKHRDALLPSMLAIDFGWNGLPRSLRWPCASSSAEMARRLIRPPLGFLRRRALPVTRPDGSKGKVLSRGARPFQAKSPVNECPLPIINRKHVSPRLLADSIIHLAYQLVVP